MTQQEALEILVQAVRLANKRGAFEIEESERIAQAIKVFSLPQNQNNETPVEENNIEE